MGWICLYEEYKLKQEATWLVAPESRIQATESCLLTMQVVTFPTTMWTETREGNVPIWLVWEEVVEFGFVALDCCWIKASKVWYCCGANFISLDSEVLGFEESKCY